MNSHRWIRLAVVGFALIPCAAEAQESGGKSSPEVLIRTKVGDLPIIISAPHGGNDSIPGVPERKGEGLERGSSGFVTARDSGTEELANDLVEAIVKRFGKPPFLVASTIHRKYLDPNRPASIAFEDPRVKPYHDYYHTAVADACRSVTDRFHKGILIDIHGQGSRRDTVFRGTKNGLTVSRLRETFGEESHSGPNSLFGLLSARGWKVYPEPLDGKEQAGFTGGHIVQTYGSHRALPIDAIQLEFGAEYRVPGRRAATAATLADALVSYAEQFLDIKVKPNSRNDTIPIAVYSDEGVSPTDKLFAALNLDPAFAPVKVSANDIRDGKLSSYRVLIHPGGSGSAQGKALGEDGRTKVREFIENGGGLVGVCAGAYLATCDYDWSLHVLDAKVIDRKHWNRGFGNVEIDVAPLGRERLKLDRERTEIYYHQGPLLAPAENPRIPDYLPLAKYATEIAKNGAPTGVMTGTTAIAIGEFGKGRVVCFSPHPEKTPNLEPILVHAIRWSAGSR